jgi:hypothetical protein
MRYSFLPLRIKPSKKFQRGESQGQLGVVLGEDMLISLTRAQQGRQQKG